MDHEAGHIGTRQRTRRIVTLVALTLMMGCKAEPIQETIASNLTVAARDLPSAFESESTFFLTPETFAQLKTEGKLTEKFEESLSGKPYHSVAVNTYADPSGREVLTQAAVFRTIDAAKEYFEQSIPQEPIKDAPSFGDESYVAKRSLGMSRLEQGAGAFESFRVRMRIANAVLEVIVTDKPGTIDPDFVYDLAAKVEDRAS